MRTVASAWLDSLDFSGMAVERAQFDKHAFQTFSNVRSGSVTQEGCTPHCGGNARLCARIARAWKKLLLLGVV